MTRHHLLKYGSKKFLGSFVNRIDNHVKENYLTFPWCNNHLTIKKLQTTDPCNFKMRFLKALCVNCTIQLTWQGRVNASLRVSSTFLGNKISKQNFRDFPIFSNWRWPAAMTHSVLHDWLSKRYLVFVLLYVTLYNNSMSGFPFKSTRALASKLVNLGAKDTKHRNRQMHRGRGVWCCGFIWQSRWPCLFIHAD